MGLFAQVVPMPTPGQDAWQWLAVLMAGALGFVFWQLLKSKDEIADDWRDQAKKMTDNEARNADTIRALAETVKGQGAAVEANTTELKRISLGIDDLSRRVDGAARRGGA